MRRAVAKEREREGEDDEVAVFSAEEDEGVNSDSTIMYEAEEEDN